MGLSSTKNVPARGFGLILVFVFLSQPPLLARAFADPEGFDAPKMFSTAPFNVLIWVFSTVMALSIVFEARATGYKGDPRSHNVPWRIDRTIAGYLLGAILASNGLAFLILSSALDGSWWSDLWMTLGAALILAAIVDLIVEVNARTS